MGPDGRELGGSGSLSCAGFEQQDKSSSGESDADQSEGGMPERAQRRKRETGREVFE